MQGLDFIVYPNYNYKRKRLIKLILGKYGKMILNNMERNYPYRKQELELI